MSFDFDQDSFKALKKTVAERTSPLVAWVGAGLSAQAGLPSWQGLINHLSAVGKRKIASMSDAGAKLSLAASLDQKIASKEYWLAFQLAREILGQVSYESEIRDQLDTDKPPPPAYLSLWRTGIQGMISLNLDHFAQQAFAQYSPGTRIDYFVGAQAKNLTGVLQRSTRFVGNPHGLIDDATGWVFTQDRVQALLKDTGYLSFISASLLTRTLIFVGVTADDIAIDSHLNAIKKAHLSGVTHYWITNRSDVETDDWAERSNIRIIRYAAVERDHSELLECLGDLAKNSTSSDPHISDPVMFSGVGRTEQIGTIDELLNEPLELMREKLNGHVLSLLSDANELAYQKYEKFEIEFDEAIDRAWYIGPPPKNVVFGYTLGRRVAQGSFGDVYEADAPDGSKVALKLLRRDVRREPAMLQTFRRGVRSMKILKAHKMLGMVDFIDASEIPAFVVMEWINGPNLLDAVSAGIVDTWFNLVKVAHDLAKIIHAAHMLPERVLHRDIRPPNVMLRDYWETQTPEVMVMDFDLSWHKDALEKSIMAKPLGFMAPEQLIGKGETRSALVDSFGFGMTLFYMLTKELPVPNQQMHKDWESSLKYKIGSRPCKEWKSLPERVMRLVYQTTLSKQNERLDFSRITSELNALSQIINQNMSSISGDYYCEEVAAWTATMDGYNWNIDKNSAIYLSGGLRIELAADLPSDSIKLQIRWQQTGGENWKNLPKTSSQVAERAAPALEKNNWEKAKYDASYGNMTVSASHYIDRQSFDPRRLAAGINAVVATMLPKN